MKIICIAGKNQIAIDVAEFVIKKYTDYKVLACVNKTDNFENNWQKSFGLFCKMNNIPIVETDELYEFRDLIFFSLEFDRIIKPEKFYSNTLFNIHFSLLPEYKGMYTSVFPILEGKDYSGVTLHKIDSGIDTGDIIDQVKFDINYNETARDLYFKYLKHGTELMLRNIDKILSDNILSKAQNAICSTYYSKKSINFNKVEINLNATAWQIHNQVRAFAFYEYQLPKVFGQKIYKTEILKTKSEYKPGYILEESNYTFKIATVDYDIILFKDKQDELLNACKEGNLESVVSICQNSFPFERKNNKGWNAAIVSAYNNKIDVLKYLVDLGADINTSNYKDTTLIMYAMTAGVKENDFSCLDFLLEKGADIYLCDFKGKNTLDYANEFNNNKLMDLLRRYI